MHHPKMELESLCLPIDLFLDVKSTIVSSISSFVAYTDSEVSLAWVRSQRPLENTFVKRRVEKIRKVVNPAHIYHVKSSENPADSA